MSKSNVSLHGMRCLVLDDEFLIALDIQQILEAAGAASVTCAASAEDALAALRRGEPYDLAVLDLKLSGPMPTSLAIAGLLTQQKLPFVFLTGARPDDALLKKYPDVPVVEKPYQAKLLLDAIGRTLTKP